MKKILTTVLTASLVASTMGTMPSSSIKVQADSALLASTSLDKSVKDLSKYETNEVIVVYKKEANATPAKTMKIASLSTEEAKTASADVLTDDAVILKLDSKDTLEDAINTLANDSRVDYVQPNYIYHATADSVDTVLSTLSGNADFSKQWGLHNDGTLSYTETDYRSDGTGSGWNYSDPWSYFPWSNSQVSTQAGSSMKTIDISATDDIDIDLPEAWASLSASSKGNGNRQAIVAFVDTGVMYDHTDLKDNMWINEAEANGTDGVDDDNNGYVDDYYGWNFYGSGSFYGYDSQAYGRPGSSSSSSNGNNKVYNSSSRTEDSHGTHGAGTIAALNDSAGTVGIASNSNVKIMSVKALGGSQGYGSTESVVKGIQYAVDNGACVVNLSLGGDEDDATLRSVIENSPNVLFTIAAGNGDSNYTGIDNDKTPTYPANYTYDNVLSVANLQCDGQLHYSSNYGASTVQLAAPGSNIYSTSTGIDSTSSSYSAFNPAISGYETMTGTSMAAPMVAGVAAMLYSKYTNATIKNVRDAILNSTVKLSSLEGKVSTGGMLNANNAVLYMDGAASTFPTFAPIVTSTPTSASKAPTATPRVSSTPRISTTPAFSSSPVITSAPVATNTPTVVPSSTPVTEQKPEVTTPVKETIAPVVTNSPSTPLTLSEVNISDDTLYAGKTYTISADASGGTGAYTYSFFISQTSSSMTKSSSENCYSWTPKKAGNYVILVFVTDKAGDVVKKYINVTVNGIKITKITPNKTAKKGATVKFTISTANGVGSKKYTYVIYRNGICVAKKTTSTASISYKFKKAGSYKIKVTVKDANGNTSSKTIKKSL